MAPELKSVMPSGMWCARPSLWQVRRFSVQCGGENWHCEALHMKDSLLVWVGRTRMLGSMCLALGGGAGGALSTVLTGEPHEEMSRALSARLRRAVLLAADALPPRESAPLITALCEHLQQQVNELQK